MKYECRFERFEIDHRDPGAYEARVSEAAAEGWRLVQIFVEQPATIASSYVIIFERAQA